MLVLCHGDTCFLYYTDEFSSEGSEHNIEVFNEDIKAVNLHAVPSIGRCRAIYDYDANMFDELTIRTGMWGIILTKIFVRFQVFWISVELVSF